MPPTVQSLDQILAELETAYAPVRNILGQQTAKIPQKYDLRRQGLEGTKVKSFDQIATSANRAGMGFTGFTAAEQGDYLADKFLPGMQQTYLDQDEEGLGIAKSLAQLDQEKRLGGMSRRSEQEKAFQAWQENERQRAFQAEQARLQREEAARQAAAARSASGGGQSAGWAREDAKEMQGIMQKVAGGLTANAGRDGRVDPTTYKKVRNEWLSIGLPAETFDSNFMRFANPTHLWDYGYGNRKSSSGSGGSISSLRF